MAKKEDNTRNNQAFDAWQRRKQEINSGIEYINAQNMWRRAALRARVAANKMTDKNWVEAKNLGLTEI